MARDYRNSNRSRTPRPSGRRKGGMFTGLMFGVVLGLLAAFGLAWYLYVTPSTYKPVPTAPRPEPPAAPVKPRVAPPVDSAAETPTVPAEGTGEPGYTFYDILPGNQSPRPLQPAQVNEVWWLQVAALKNSGDANNLRAQLQQLNFDAVVQATQGGESTLYRVRVGPFRTRNVAESARETLIANNFEPRVLKEPVKP